MALGITIVKKINIKQAEGLRFRIIELTGDASYAAGGYAITAANCDLNGIDAILPCGTMGADGAAGTGLTMRWDSVNGKMKLYKGAGSAALTESGGTDPSALKGTALVIGY